ncbi:MAG TPA: hypothetical protein VKA66_21460 [Mycobacterium sp.]|nr:hypothetical protein [Mycobacterium sp.]
MFKRTEGSGLAAPPEQPWEAEPQPLATAGAMHLDGVAARFDPGREYTTAEAKKLIQRVCRLKSADHAGIDAVFTSLLQLGALKSVVWRLGPKVVRRADDVGTPHSRRKASRDQYELCLNEVGDWQAVKRSDADAFRRRVTLWQLDADDREAERKAETRRRLRAEVEAEAS